MAEKKQNILFIFCDQLRYDALGCTGNSVIKTPNIDRLAREGLLFSRAYTSSTVCVPARFSLLSERYPHQMGIYHNNNYLWADAPSFVRCLNQAGYVTANWGKLHFCAREDIELPLAGPLLNMYGFSDPHEINGKASMGYVRYSEYVQHLMDRGVWDVYVQDLYKRVQTNYDNGGVCTAPYGHGPSVLPEEDHVDAWVMDRSDAWIRERNEEPFFLWCGPPGPHDPYDPPEPWASMYKTEDMPPPIEGKACGETTGFDLDVPPRLWQENRAQYYGNVSLIDNRIGKLLATLEEKGLRENTWIIFTTDHGDHLGDFGLPQKVTFYESVTRIPLIVCPPPSLQECRRGETCDAMVSLIDVAATMTEIAGGDRTPGGLGKSLLPLIRGETPDASHREVLFSEVSKIRMTMTRKWKMVTDRETHEVLRLTDMDADPLEQNNLAESAEHRNIISDLKKRHLEPFLKESPADLPEPWARVTPARMWPRNPFPGAPDLKRGKKKERE